jgi:hypothetical protein
MRTVDVDHNVVQLQVRDLRDAQAAAARKADDHEVAMDVCRTSRARGQVGKDGGEFAAGQQTGLVQVPG